MRNNRIISVISLILTLSIFMANIPASSIRADDNIVRCYSVAENIDYEVKVDVVSVWQDHANIDLVISNIGDTSIDDWYLTFSIPYVIENIWNAEVIDTDDNGTYTIKNLTYNQDIPCDSSVTIGITLFAEDSSFDEFPQWYLLNMKEYEVDNSFYVISYSECSNWGSGFTGELSICSSENMEDWSVYFDSEYQITDVSNATISVSEEGSYCLRNDGINQNIYADIPMDISIQGVPAENSLELNNLEVRRVSLAYGLDEDNNYNGNPDYMDFIISTDDKQVLPVSTDETIVTDIPTVTAEPTITSEPFDETDYFLDSDGDMLTDYTELMYGTNKDNPDSDHDNISDYQEILLGYDPNNDDSDGNGKNDGEEDYDMDGVSNAVEIEFGTDPKMNDTDLDDLIDYEEIYVYGTNPNADDSNADGITDGDAVYLGLDPISTDTDGNGIPDNKEKIHQYMEVEISESDINRAAIQKVCVEGDIANKAKTVLTIENVYGRHEYSTDIPGQIGVPVNIECDSEFDELTLSFCYDETKLGEADEDDLRVYYLDEDTGFFIDSKATVDKENNKLVVVTNHLCDWTLVNYKKYSDFWRYTACGYNVKCNTAQTSKREGTIYTLMIQFGNLMEEEEKTNTLIAVNDLMNCISENDRVVVYCYNSSNPFDQYNYLVLGEWLDEYNVQATKLYTKEESAQLLLALHNIFYGDYKENYYANLMTVRSDNGQDIDYANLWYQKENHIEPEKESEASEEATNILMKLLWYYYSCEFRVKKPDNIDFQGDYRTYVVNKYKENDDFYFHMNEHENVCIAFANGKQQLVADKNSPLENDGNWEDFGSYFANYPDYNVQLYLVNTGSRSDSIKLDLSGSFDGIHCKNEYANGLWPYTHGGLINLVENDFASEFTRLRELSLGLDADEDELWDIYEETGMITANGKILHSDPTKKNSDNDGNIDGEEMGACYTIVAYKIYGEDGSTNVVEVNGRKIDRETSGGAFDNFFDYGFGKWTLYTYNSNPELDDTDGDYYYDDKDSNPLKNCLSIYDLGGGEFNPFYIDDGYLHIENAPLQPYSGYGGNQGWFEQIVPYGDVSSYKYNNKIYYGIAERGCGLIALNDVLLYKEGKRKMDFSEYENAFFSVVEHNRNYTDYFFVNNDDFVVSAPILPRDISSIMDSQSRSNFCIDVWMQSTKIKSLLIDSIERGNPVILCEIDIGGEIYNELMQNKKRGFQMFSKLTAGYEDRGFGLKGIVDPNNIMTDHYVTITGIIIDSDSDKMWLRIQTWGEQYFLLYSDFVCYNSSNGFATGTLIFLDE